MTLEHHKEIIIQWAKSCETSEQLNLLSDIIDTFIIKRFINEDRLHVILAVEEIERVMQDQRANIIVIETTKHEVPTLAYYQNSTQ